MQKSGTPIVDNVSSNNSAVIYPTNNHTEENVVRTALDLSKLNKEQHEAVTWPGGAIQIFAGAGSGKTRVITYRIAHLIEKGAHPGSILAVTFTNKAARELQERIEQLLGNTTRGMWVGTFHSIAVKMLRMYGIHIGIDPNFVIYDTNDSLAVIKEILKEKNIDEKSFQPKNILYAISEAKEKFISPEKYSASSMGFFEGVVAKVYTSYREKLQVNNALDFDDLLYYSVELLDTCEEARDYYQNRFQHVLVDEYQDINDVQYKMVHLLAGKHKNITVVGDDDQSIYAWRGANIQLMYKFRNDYPDTKVIKLMQNYRSTKKILEAAHSVIVKNTSREEKQLWTSNEEGENIHLIESGSEYDEALIVANKILNEVQDGNKKFGEFAILYRTNAQSRVLEETLLNLRVPHVLIGGQRFYDRKEIKDTISYLRLLINPYDSISLKRVINTPARGIGTTTIANLDKVAYEESCSVWEILTSSNIENHFTKRTAGLLEMFTNTIKKAKEYSENHTISETTKYILEKSGYLESLRNEKTADAQSRVENLNEFLNVTSTYENTADEPSLLGFLESVALVADVDNLVENGDAVTLMTLHASKGLEFPVVFLCGLEEGIFPHSRTLQDETELAEERRLCYVGITRAKQHLHLLYATQRSMYGQPVYNPPSRFIEDLPQQLLNVKLSNRAFNKPGMFSQNRNHSPYKNDRNKPYQNRYNRKEEPDIFEEEQETKTLFKSGEHVKHVKFGTGVVINCTPLSGNDYQVTVAFPGIIGVKKLVQSIAKLEKHDS